MYGNNSLTVTQKVCDPHYQIFIQRTTGTISWVNHMTHQRAVGELYIIRV